MAILKDLIVHGSSRFLNKIYASEIQTPLIKAEAGIIKKLKADDTTIVGLLDVQGQLHTSSWTNSNIATIDGSFYITPTIESSQGTVGNISTSTLNFSRKSGGDDFATVSSLYLGNDTSITWPRYSKILITGQILLNGEWIPLGTLLGQLNAAATAASIKVYNITDNKHRESSILVTLANSGITSTTYRNLKISLYQRANGASSFYPLGIYMTATGINGKTFLDIYGGVELLNSNINNSNNYGGFADPNVRIGNLQGLPSVGGQTPKGWGIYTDNGYFKGIIAADKGYIGSGSKYWVIANEEDVVSRSYIYNGTNSVTSTIEGVYLGTDGIRNYKDNTHNVTIKDGVITALGVDLSGKITASSGSIAGWTIKSSYLINSTTATAPGDNLLLLSPNGTSTRYTIAGQLLSGWTFTSGTTFGINKDGGVYATFGKIGGWNLNSDGFYITNSIPGYNANTLVISKGTASTNAIGGSDTTSKNWMISAGTGFGVTTTGALYANDAHISGEITATSGTIGGIRIVNGDLDVSSINIGSLNGANNYAQKTDITNAIDNLQIGGRNLILDTATPHSSRTDDIQYIASYMMSDYGKSLMNNTEDYFTLSFDYEIQGDYSTASNNSRIYAMINGTTVSPPNPIYVKNSPSTGHYSTTCKMTQAQVDSTADACRVRWNGIVEGCTFTVKNYKVEKGNKETSWTPAPEDIEDGIDHAQNTANVALSQSVEYIIGTQTAVTGSWTGISNTISELKDGTQIRYWLPHAGNGNATLNLTLTNGTTTGAIPIYRQGGSVSNGNVVANRVTTHFPTGSVVSMTYGIDRSISVVSSGTTYTGLFTGWFADGAYDSGNTINRVRLQNVITAETAITAGRIICGTANGYKNIGANVSFDLSYPLLYAVSAIAASKTGDNNYLSINGISATNNGTVQSGVAKKTLYLKGNVTGNTFKISASPFMTTVQPTTNDGYYYIPLGIMYSTTAIYFQSSNRLYAYIDGAFQPVDTAAVLRAEEAKKVATNYITQIDNTGIKIAPYDKSGNDYLQLNSNAISMYRNNIETLRIEDNAIRVGKTNEAHFSLTSSRLVGYGDNNNVYFEAGKGDNTTIQLFYGNGERTSFEIGPLVKGTSQFLNGIKSIKKDGNTLTEETDYVIDTVSIWYDIYFQEEPTLYSTVTIEYKSAYKEFIYTVGSSQNITTTQSESPDGTTIIYATLNPQRNFEAKELWVKNPGQEKWEKWLKDSQYQVNKVNNNYTYTINATTGTQIKLIYFILDDSSFISDPDIQTKEFLWDITYQGSLNLTIKDIYEINSVKINNVNVDYTSEGPLYKDYLVLNTALGQNEKIEIEFFTRNYNAQYYSTYFNFSNMNKEDSIKGIGAASFGSENVNKGIFCLAEGVSNVVTGYASHAEGYNNVVAGSHAHAGGTNSLALGQNTFVHGDNLQATYLNSAAFGHYNDPNNQLFSIGKGNYQNAFSINKDGNVQFGGRLLSGTTYENKIPLFKIIEKVYTSHGVGGNEGFSIVRDITIKGYKPIAILGFSVTNMPGHPTSTEADASWCIIPRIWIGYDYTHDHPNYKTDSLYYYFWNLNTSKGVNVKIGVKILYIAKLAYPDFSQQEEEA